jgi:hypothetical protein
MVRTSLTSLIVGSLLLAAPSVAAAEDCTCAVGGQQGWPVAATDPERPATLAPAFAQEKTADEAAPPPAPSGRVLWCTGSDDPRCKPARGDGSDSSQTVFSSPVLGDAASRHGLGRPDRRDLGLVSTTTGPLAGHRGRVERPPRR